MLFFQRIFVTGDAAHHVDAAVDDRTHTKRCHRNGTHFILGGKCGLHGVPVVIHRIEDVIGEAAFDMACDARSKPFGCIVMMIVTMVVIAVITVMMIVMIAVMMVV